MNVALRAVHDALGREGERVDRWRSLVAALRDGTTGGTVVNASALRAPLRTLRCGGSPAEWLRNLHTLGVLSPEGQLEPARAEDVGTALELVGDSFTTLGLTPFWAPVVTVPTELRALLRPPPVRQTAGILLDLIDGAAKEIRLAAPFVDEYAAGFLADPLLGAGRRTVTIGVITSPGQGVHFRALARRWHGDQQITGDLRLCEVRTQLSSLGSHAKVMAVDGERGYVGSANLTAAGLGRHIEVGVELAGPHVAELTRVLDALERVGSTIPIGDD